MRRCYITTLIFLGQLLLISQLTMAQTMDDIKSAMEKLKTGGWVATSITKFDPPMQGYAPQPVTADICMDENSREKMINAAHSMGDAQYSNITHDGDNYAYDATMNGGNHVSTMHVEMNIPNDSEYQNTMVIKNNNLTTTVKVSYKFTGDCVAGMNPGDTRPRVNDGMNTTVNVNDFLQKIKTTPAQ